MMGPLNELKEKCIIVATESDVRVIKCEEFEVTLETVKFLKVEID